MLGKKNFRRINILGFKNNKNNPMLFFFAYKLNKNKER